MHNNKKENNNFSASIGHRRRLFFTANFSRTRQK